MREELKGDFNRSCQTSIGPDVFLVHNNKKKTGLSRCERFPGFLLLFCIKNDYMQVVALIINLIYFLFFFTTNTFKSAIMMIKCLTNAELIGQVTAMSS